MITTDWMAVGGFFVAILGLLGTGWWRITVMIRRAADDAQKARDEIAAHRLHVAETYITKDGVREVIDPVLELVRDVKAGIGHLTSRVDALFTSKPPPARRA